MLCRRCLLNGRRIDGGALAVCRVHAKTRCLICRAPSLGEELCSAHAHQVDLARWKAKANLRIIDPAEEIDLAELRKEKLAEAKFHAHEAIEIFFRALFLALQAIWGTPATPADDPQEGRKAA